MNYYIAVKMKLAMYINMGEYCKWIEWKKLQNNTYSMTPFL